jgi:hypothetical protein
LNQLTPRPGCTTGPTPLACFVRAREHCPGPTVTGICRSGGSRLAEHWRRRNWVRLAPKLANLTVAWSPIQCTRGAAGHAQRAQSGTAAGPAGQRRPMTAPGTASTEPRGRGRRRRVLAVLAILGRGRSAPKWKQCRDQSVRAALPHRPGTADAPVAAHEHATRVAQHGVTVTALVAA